MVRQFLNRSNIIAAFEHVWRKGMLKNMYVAQLAPEIPQLNVDPFIR